MNRSADGAFQHDHLPLLAPGAVAAVGAFDEGVERGQVRGDRFAHDRAQSVASIARAAATGSSARLIGRPMTRTLAPASRAERGVTTRF